jgi:hypothetical protein
MEPQMIQIDTAKVDPSNQPTLTVGRDSVEPSNHPTPTVGRDSVEPSNPPTLTVGRDSVEPSNRPTPTVGRDSVESSNSESHGSTETEQIKSGPLCGLSRPTNSQTLPTSFHDLALQVVFAIYQDVHIKGSGLVFFALLGYGVLSPQNKEQCQQLAALAGTYLFGAAINRK